MSTKSHLYACGEALLIGRRASERAEVPDPRVMATLRARLDVIEQLEHGSQEVTVEHVATALAIIEHAAVEFGTEPVAPHAILVAVRRAVDRLQRLKMTLES